MHIKNASVKYVRYRESSVLLLVYLYFNVAVNGCMLGTHQG